ncbi:MAG: hypothetical protein Q8P40_05705 [Nitrospirota bacterium]|nr:hypothetical protein [Nitrospirota bacterium]
MEDLRNIFKATFDLSFEAMFAAGFVQREQDALFRASLFEEATKSFKKAMKFPLIEESEERKK